MSETKFTPGPWSMNGERRLVGDAAKDGQHMLYVGEVRSPAHVGCVAYIQSADHCETGITRDAAEANALLLLAAPDMYAALQCAQNVLTLLQDEVSRLGCRADQVTEKIAAALAKANGGQA